MSYTKPIPRRTKGSGPKIIVFSGAGLDAPSGIRTFRDSNGLWNEYKIEDVCTESTWKRNFEVVHSFYNERRADLANTQPNHAHYVLKELEEEYKEDFIHVTMNVSDLIEKARGSALHVHGDLTKMECTACGHKWTIGYKRFDIEKHRCPNCDSLKGVKPFIVFFGGIAPMYTYMSRAFEYASHPDSVFLIIGTQGNVVPVEMMLNYTPCKKFLLNMEQSVDINVNKLGNCTAYYESVEDSIDKVREYIDKNFKR